VTISSFGYRETVVDVVDPPVAHALWCAEFELSADSEPHGVAPRSSDQARSRVLVRLHGEPLGYVLIGRGSSESDVHAILDVVNAEMLDALNAHLRAEGLAEMTEVAPELRPPAAAEKCPNHIPPIGLISVVVCTRDRASVLGSCLRRLGALTYPELEFIVVDNAPSDGSTEILVKDFASNDDRFHYVREPVPGLSSARNRGLATAQGTWVAFTDDDVSVDPGWVDGLVRGFRRRPDIACVTGLVCTANITNAAEAYFDARAASWSTRCTPETFDMADIESRGPLYPYSAGIYGTGANFAIERDLMLNSGGFDVALGAGTRTRGGEDLDMFVRVLRSGRAITYEPAAVVWHHHRADEQALLKQMYGYGAGLSAFLIKLTLDSATRRDLLRRIPGGIRKLRSISGETTERMDNPVATPPGAVRRERIGFLAGPYLYFRARRESARRGAPSSNKG
jgi:glycosyltransferase involved in cell wall biosynthesis